MNEMNLKTFCTKYKGTLTKGAAVVGTAIAVTVMVALGFKKKVVETCGANDLVADD